MKVKLFEKSLHFSKASKFHVEMESPSTGSVFLATTEPDDSKMRISCAIPKGGFDKHILTIQVGDQPFKTIATQDKVCISFPGHEPDDPVQGGSGSKKPLAVELDATKGDWHVEQEADSLKISFGGSEPD